MTPANDGWGKLPTNSDPWTKAQGTSAWPHPDTWTQPVNTQSAPAPNAWPVSDGWGVPVASWKEPISQDLQTQAQVAAIMLQHGTPAQQVEAFKWTKELDERDKFCGGDQWTPDQLEKIEAANANWTASALEGANNRAAVINSLRGVKDQYTIDQDGELSNIKETIAKPSDKETGVYIAYSNGKWLHAILSGPYTTRDEADKWADVAFELLTNDGAFKLAFENTFDRDGVYYAEIPLSAKRHGAYGVLS